MHSLLLDSCAIGVGATTGAIARFILTNQAKALKRPLFGVPIVNIFGSFTLGALATAAKSRASFIPKRTQLCLGVGFCGSFTTFSTFALEFTNLIERSQYASASKYFLINNIGSVTGIIAGSACARRLKL